MEKNKLSKQIEQIREEIKNLPSGNISNKKINGKVYAYYQWREDGKQRSRRAKDDELTSLSANIERRKKLQEELKILEGVRQKEQDANFRSLIRRGEDLLRFVEPVRNFKKRDCMKSHNLFLITILILLK